MRPFLPRRSGLVMASLALLLATFAGVLMAGPTSADTEGARPGVPPQYQDVFPLEGPLCRDSSNRLYLDRHGRCGRGQSLVTFSNTKPIKICTGFYAMYFLANGQCGRNQQQLELPSSVVPVKACAYDSEQQLRQVPSTDWCGFSERKLSQRPLVVVVDFFNHRVQKFFDDGTFISSWGSLGTDPGQFLNPRAIATDAANNSYVFDLTLDNVQVFDPSGNYLRQWGSAGEGTGQFAGPSGITVDRKAGRVYTTETVITVARVQVFDLFGNFITTWGGRGDVPGEFDLPVGVAVDAHGLVYVVDGVFNDRIQVFDPSGAFIREWGVEGSGNGEFQRPAGIAIGDSGEVFVTDGGNNRVQVFDQFGNYLRQWGSGGSGPGQFNNPDGIAVDSMFGLVYIADVNNSRIQVFDRYGAFLGQWGSLGDGNGEFNNAMGIALIS